MLKSLSIRNIALIDRADIEFSEGLNVLSGETGAGKSVILDSIDFVLGAKADKSMIRFGQAECSVRAEFSADEELNALLEELDLEPDETLVLSRKFGQDGKGSAKVNGCTVSATMLRRITSRLVDVHGQSEHFFLLKESNQLRLLDRIAGVEREKAKVSELLSARKELINSLSLLGGDESERSRRLDILRFQIGEIERAGLKKGEEESLLALRTKYQNAEKILEGLSAARAYLAEDGGATDSANSALRALRSIARFGDYNELCERLENALAELDDLGGEIESLAAELDVDEEELGRVESRIDEIRSLKKKYGGSEEEIDRFLQNAREERDLLENSGARYEKLTAELASTDDALYSACVALTNARKACAAAWTKRVTKELETLNISSARFEVEFDGYTRDDVSKATAEGLDGVRFLFSANAGEPLKELGKIISGGEMSRFMLAVKAQLSSMNGIGTYIFDEIDAGIGGKTAKVVAEKFVKISQTTQIIAVSHLAQIAAAADRQFLIEKTEAGDKTYTRVHALNGEERRAELARLLSGDTGELSLSHADQLLEEAKKYKK